MNSRKKILPGWLLMVFLIFIVGGVVVAYNYMVFRDQMMERNRGIPPIKELPEFRLTTANGATFTKEDMLGRVWLADFIFTRCPGPCIILSQKLQDLQEEWLPEFEQLSLLSVTVDPAFDTPRVLADYAERFDAGPRWHFLTGPRKQVYDLIVKGFMLPVVEQHDPEKMATEGHLIHSTRLALVDKAGMIRGYYDSESPEAMAKLREDIRHLQENYE